MGAKALTPVALRISVPLFTPISSLRPEIATPKTLSGKVKGKDAIERRLKHHRRSD